MPRETNDKISTPSTVEFVRGSLYDPANIYSYSSNPTNYYVAEGNSGSLYLDTRCTYTGKLTGEGVALRLCRRPALRPERRLVGIPRHAHGRIPETWKQLRSRFPNGTTTRGMPNATLNIPERRGIQCTGSQNGSRQPERVGHISRHRHADHRK